MCVFQGKKPEVTNQIGLWIYMYGENKGKDGIGLNQAGEEIHDVRHF